MPTQGNGASRLPLVAIGLVVLLATVGLGVWSISGQGAPLATLTVDSSPTGALVKRDGVVICNTPCTRSDLPPGDFSFTVEKAGYTAAGRSVVLKGGVTENVGTLALEPEKAPPPEVIKLPPEVKNPPAVVTSLVTIESEPPGAEVRLNGEVVGATPFSRSLPFKTAVEVHLELAGYAPQVDRFAVGEGAEDPHRYTLKALGKSTVKPIGKNPPPVDVPKPPAVASRGTLRFVVKPWADVECREAGIKDTTPFQDKLVPVGNYSCTFTNPEFPPQTRLVKVEPNTTVKVQVNFLQ